MARTEFEMIKRLLAMVAVIGVTIPSMVFAPATAWAGKRVALIVGNSTYQTVPQASQSVTRCERRRQDV